jgi:hypothetical protein
MIQDKEKNKSKKLALGEKNNGKEQNDQDESFAGN